MEKTMPRTILYIAMLLATLATTADAQAQENRIRERIRAIFERAGNKLFSF
jgi:hypothetical protein